MRQSTRGVQYTPKATYTDFSKGMEYTAHAKDNNNPRAQLIKNMEIAPDGRLKVRRPLVPVMKNTDGRIDKPRLPEGHIKLKTLYTPFRDLADYPFITFMYDPTGISSGKSSNIYIIWCNKNKQGFGQTQYFYDQNKLLDDLYHSNNPREIEGVFIPGIDVLKLNAYNGQLDLSFTNNAPYFVVTRPTVYNASVQDIVDQGINLYGENPLFIPNVITAESNNTIIPQALLPYKASDAIKSALTNVDTYEFSPSNWIYDAEVQPSDNVMLKPLLRIPEFWIEHELKSFFSFNFSTNRLEWKKTTSGTMEDVLKNGLNLNSNELDAYAPSWHWDVVEGTSNNIIATRPAAGATQKMPVLFTFLYDVTSEKILADIVARTFSTIAIDLTKVYINNSVSDLIIPLLQGKQYTNRPDLYRITNTSSGDRYRLSINFSSALVETWDEQVINPAAGTGEGLRRFSILSEVPAANNVFNDATATGSGLTVNGASPQNALAAVTTALNPTNKQLIVATPSGYVHGFASTFEFGDENTASGMDANGFILYLPQSIDLGSRLNLAVQTGAQPTIAQGRTYYWDGYFSDTNWDSIINFSGVSLNTFTTSTDWMLKFL